MELRKLILKMGKAPLTIPRPLMFYSFYLPIIQLFLGTHHILDACPEEVCTRVKGPEKDNRHAAGSLQSS